MNRSQTFLLEKKMPSNNSFNEERFVAVLEEAINKVKTEEDPVLLTDMKKLFKKHVPFTLRTYVAAYLAKQACQGFKGGSKYSSRTEGFNKGNDRGARKERPAPRQHQEEVRRENTPEPTITERTAPRRVTIDEEYAATVFIGIGKNRRVYTRDLITLLMQVCKLDRERIGRIRNQENYSFVELFKEDVDDVINTLNGYNYRGRNLTVSYARKKDDDSAEDTKKLDAASVATSQAVSPAAEADTTEE